MIFYCPCAIIDNMSEKAHNPNEYQIPRETDSGWERIAEEVIDDATNTLLEDSKNEDSKNQNPTEEERSSRPPLYEYPDGYPQGVAASDGYLNDF